MKKDSGFKWLLMFFAYVMITVNLNAQQLALYHPEDQQIFNEYLEYIKPWKSDSNEIILEKTAMFFLETPYVAHTLEVTDSETLIVNLREFDCFTYVETVLALYLTVKSDLPALDTFARNLQSIRYRDGEIAGYPSRLHYTSDWLYNNEQSGLLKNISGDIGGVREDKRIDFMSAHRDSYKHLKTDDEMLERIKVAEDNINSRGGFMYLPKANIAIAAPMIPHMAMIGFTTTVEGLDTTHVGFAFHTDEGMTFIHASSIENKIVIDESLLSDYCNSRNSCTGVIVAEVL